eukprot:2562813-Pleurochrysis_carterae.AAC.2
MSWLNNLQAYSMACMYIQQMPTVSVEFAAHHSSTPKEMPSLGSGPRSQFGVRSCLQSQWRNRAGKA